MTPPVDKSELMDILLDNASLSQNIELNIKLDIESNIELDIKLDTKSNVESDTPLATKVESIINIRVQAVKVHDITQRIKELLKIDSIFISNTLVLNIKGKTKTFSILVDSSTKVNIINRISAQKIGLLVLNTNIRLSIIYREVVKTYRIYYIEFQ